MTYQIDVRRFTFRNRKRESGYWEALHVDCGKRDIKIYRSPTGRSVRIYVDGNEVKQ